jgi:hypothetical protein
LYAVWVGLGYTADGKRHNFFLTQDKRVIMPLRPSRAESRSLALVPGKDAFVPGDSLKRYAPMNNPAMVLTARSASARSGTTLSSLKP